MEANPVLVEMTRGSLTESFHRGAFCIVDRNNRVIVSAGDIHRIIYPRSAMKFFQVSSLLVHGGKEKFGFTEAEIAVMCASHNGEKEHLALVQSILTKCGLGEKDLGCGAHLPMYAPAVSELLVSGKPPGALHNNCSGKHAGFLALSLLLGENPAKALEYNSLTQKSIRDQMSVYFEMNLDKVPHAFDGCSAPVYAVPLIQLAVAFKNLSAELPGLKNVNELIVRSVSSNPFAVAGSERYDTEMMQHFGTDVIGKVGAEGIFGLAFHKLGYGAAMKIDDGKMLPQYIFAQKLLRESGLFPEESMDALKHWEVQDVVNWNTFVTGKVQAVYPLPHNFLKHE